MATWSTTSKRVSVMETSGKAITEVPTPSLVFIRDVDWDRQSSRLAIMGIEADGQRSVWIARADGEQAHRVFVTPEPLNSVRWSPLIDSIYTMAVGEGTARLLALDVGTDGRAQPRVVIAGLPPGGSLSVSSDGRSLLHIRAQASTNLQTVDLDRPGAAPKALTQGTRQYVQPRVSPDGLWIAASVGSSAPNIVRLPVTGGEPEFLTSGDHQDMSPAWSPDGSRIAFASRRDGSPALWVMTQEGRELERVDAGPVGTNLRVDWTPDGQITWQQATENSRLDYRIRDLGTGNESWLSAETGVGWLFDPRFAPHDDRVAVYWNRPPRGLWLVTWPARKSRPLAADLGPIGWSPDGRWIYAIGNPVAKPEVWTVSAETGQARLLTTLPDGVISSGDVTPDGRHLVLSVSERRGDAWIVDHLDPQVP